MECCVFCRENDESLMQCKDTESRVRFYRVAVIKNTVKF